MFKKFIFLFDRKNCIAVALIGGLLIWGCTTAPKRTFPTGTMEEARLKSICDNYRMDCQWDLLSHTMTLKVNNKEAKVLVGSSVAVVNGQKVDLDGPVQMVKSEIIVPTGFKQKVTDRLVPQREEKKTVVYDDERRSKVIILDAGHGGKDPGAISPWGSQEKNLVLDIARRTKELLTDRGFKVILTRDRDEFLSLERRTEIVSSLTADVFVSIHANSHPSRAISGIEVYGSKDLDSMEKREPQRAQNEQSLFRQLQMARNMSTVMDIVSDLLYTHKKPSSERLARSVSKYTTRLTHAKNLGVKTARFYVLRNTLIPAVLIEVGFLTNQKEEKELRQNDYRQKLAEGITKGIVEYVKD